MPEWLPVVGYEGLYEVSDDGQVRSLPGTDSLGRVKAGRLLALSRNGGGYLLVTLYHREVRRAVNVHRIVAEAFLGPAPDGCEVRHLDGNKLNNRMSNLAYGTSRENKLDTIAHGTHRQVTKTHCPQGHPYEGDNLMITSRGGRKCRICQRGYVRNAHRAHSARLSALARTP